MTLAAGEDIPDMFPFHSNIVLTRASIIASSVGRAGATNQRTALFVAVFAVTLALITLDVITWIELDIAAIFGLPLVLVGPTRSRRLLWSLTALLTITTFAVYAIQIPQAPSS